MPQVVTDFDVEHYPDFARHEPELRSLAEEYYPQIVNALWSDPAEAPTSFSVEVKERLKGAELGRGGLRRVKLSGEGLHNATHMLPHMFLHEMAHVAQNVPRLRLFWSVPRHWIEGLADYAVFKSGMRNDAVVPCCTADFPMLESGYSCAGAFLLFLDRQFGEDVVRELNRRVCRGRYDDDYFREATGHSLEELWAQFAQTPAYTPAAREMGMIIEALELEWDPGSLETRQEVIDYIQSLPGGMLAMQARFWISRSDALRGGPDELNGTTGDLTFGLVDGIPPPGYPFTQVFQYSPEELFPDVYQFEVTKPNAGSEWSLERITRINAEGERADWPLMPDAGESPYGPSGR